MKDDFAYIVNEDNNQGFFTSNRLQGKGFNDLYSFTLEEDVRPGECFITVDGRVIDKDTYEEIGGATVDLYTLDGSLIESISTYADGTYKFTVSCAKEYQLVASNPEYLDDKKRIEILEENYHSALHTNLSLTRIAKKKPVLKSLSPIYYEFDDANITAEAAKEITKIAEIMKSNTDLIIEASSYTDAQGTDAYNIELSKRRAQAAVEYLTSLGIDQSRIRSKAYGEERLVNECVNGVACDDQAHRMNRRTEFNFVNIDAKPKAKSGSAKTKVAIRNRRKTQQNSTVVQTKQKVDPLEVSKEGLHTLSSRSFDRSSIETAEISPIENKSENLRQQAVNESTNTEAISIAEAETTAQRNAQKEVPVSTVTSDQIKDEEEIIESKEEIALTVNDDKEKGNDKMEETETNNSEITSVEDQSETTGETEPKVEEAVIINYNSSIVATNPESNKVLNYIGSEKIKMIDQLSELELKYQEAIPNYPKLSDSLKVEKEKIAEVINKAKNLEETGWSNIIEYKNNLLHFKRRYRDLMVSHGRNKTSGSSSRRERQLAHSSAKAADEKEVHKSTAAAKELATVDENESLSVDKVQITALKKNGKGKYQKTNNANKTDLIKVSFKLLHNKKVNSGKKDAYLVLQNPEGKVEEAKGIFKIKDSETESKYTDHSHHKL